MVQMTQNYDYHSWFFPGLVVTDLEKRMSFLVTGTKGATVYLQNIFTDQSSDLTTVTHNGADIVENPNWFHENFTVESNTVIHFDRSFKPKKDIQEMFPKEEKVSFRTHPMSYEFADRVSRLIMREEILEQIVDTRKQWLYRHTHARIRLHLRANPKIVIIEKHGGILGYFIDPNIRLSHFLTNARLTDYK